MSFFSSPPQQRSPGEDIEGYIQNRSPGRDRRALKIDSPEQSASPSRGSPLKHADLSPVVKDQSESLYSSNPTNYFPASPIPRVVITEALKIGSGRKSKDTGFFSPDRYSSHNENQHKMVVSSPLKKGISTSPRKENIQRSPHKVSSDVYNYPSPSKDQFTMKITSTNEDKQGDEQYHSNEPKKPLIEINLINAGNPPATSYADAPVNKEPLQVQPLEARKSYNSFVGSMFDSQDDKDIPKAYRVSLPVTPGDRLEKADQEKVYPTTHSPKVKIEASSGYDDDLVIQDTPTVYKNIEFRNNMAKAFEENDGQVPAQNDSAQPGESSNDAGLSSPSQERKSFDLRRNKSAGKSEADKIEKKYMEDSGKTPVIQEVIQEVSSRAENLESVESTQRGSYQPKAYDKNSLNPENGLPSTARDTFNHSHDFRDLKSQSKSAIISPKSGQVVKINHSKASSKQSEKDFESRVENLTVDNFAIITEDNSVLKAAELNEPASQIIRKIRKHREKHIDTIFLPKLTSLVNSIKNNKRPEWKALEWFRLVELYKQYKPTLYDEITPLSIKPGILKNYDFLTVVAALAEYPEIVKALIYNQNFNAEGCYSVKVCRDGVWRFIMVDDFVPCVKESNKVPHKPAFLRVQNNDKKIDVWPIIYEKAWAKEFDTYQNLETTSIDQMLRDSLGAPCDTYPVKNTEQVWNVLCEAITQGHIVIASAKGNKGKLSDEEIYEKGLNPLYGNMVLDISLTRTSPSETKTIKLRNVWNDEHTWNSEYTDANAETLRNEKAILMTLEEFCSIYTDIYVSRFTEAYVYRSMVMRHVHHAYSIAKFKCTVPMECVFQLVQIDHRFYRGDPSYQYSNSRLLIFKEEGGQMTYVAGSLSNSKYNTMKIVLQEGNYYAIGLMDWKNKVHDFTLSSYGESEIKFERVHYREDPGLLAKLLEKTFLGQGIQRTLKYKDFVKYEKTFDDLKMKADLFVNRSSTRPMNILRKASKLQNASVLNTELSARNDVQVHVKPGNSSLILVGAMDFTQPYQSVFDDIVLEHMR